jgi:hypothetical protein
VIRKKKLVRRKRLLFSGEILEPIPPRKRSQIVSQDNIHASTVMPHGR